MILPRASTHFNPALTTVLLACPFRNSVMLCYAYTLQSYTDYANMDIIITETAGYCNSQSDISSAQRPAPSARIVPLPLRVAVSSDKTALKSPHTLLSSLADDSEQSRTLTLDGGLHSRLCYIVKKLR